jgi:hypothetical protein
LLGIFFLYSILRRRAGTPAARLGALIYSLLPYHLFFGRVFMPDVPALALALGGLDSLDRWTEDRRWRTLFLAAALTSLAVLQKLTVIFVGLPALYLFWLAQRRRILARPEAYLFAGIALLPALGWYTQAAALARQSGFTIMPSGSFGAHLGRWLEPSFTRGVFSHLAGEGLSPLGFALALLGLVWLSPGRSAWTFRLWLAGSTLLLILVPDVLAENYYYLSLLLPGCAALAGLALAGVAQHRRSFPLLAVVLVLFAIGAIDSALRLCRPDRSLRDFGVLLNRLTTPQDLIVTDSASSATVLYFADRRGWIGADFDAPRLERLTQAGARYYASMGPLNSEGHRKISRAVDARFQRLTPDDAPWTIYSLDSLPIPLHELPTGEIQIPYLVNYDHQIELLGVSLREVLDWPTSFEVTYYWQCLKTTATNLVAFVHFTTPAGQLVFQQDHWPLARRFMTSRWKVGDVIRERYIVTMPPSVPPGRYQLRAGWWDPEKGPRLPIVDPATSDGEDRAVAAEIEVRRAPRYRWFAAD